MDDLSTLLTDPVFAGGYNQIPLTKQSIYPLKDLQATGGLDRLAIFPDDLLPSLSLLYVLDTQGNPQTLQCETDKALDVFVVNSSGGGGGGNAPVQLTSISDIMSVNSGSGLNFSADALPVPCTLYRMAIDIGLDINFQATNLSGSMSLVLTDVLGGDPWFVWGFELNLPAHATAGYNPVMSKDVDFNFPRKMGSLWPGATSVGMQLKSITGIDMVVHWTFEYGLPV